MENSYIVYEHVSKEGKRYIGITSQDIKKRWRNGNGYIKNTHFYRAILKYGWDSFKHNILYDNVTEEEAKRLERLLIEKYQTTDPKYGYNVTRGGDNRMPCTEETRRKISNKLKGKKRTEDTKKKMSEAAKKRPKRVLTDEQKRRISLSLIGNKRAIGNFKNRKRLAMCDDDCNIILKFNCAKEAAIKVGCTSSGINRACKENENYENLCGTKYGGKYAGYKWFYLDKNDNIKRTATAIPKNNKRNTQIYKCTIEGTIIKKYDKIKDAESANEMNRNNLSFALKGKDSVIYRGFLWQRAPIS